MRFSYDYRRFSMTGSTEMRLRKERLYRRRLAVCSIFCMDTRASTASRILVEPSNRSSQMLLNFSENTHGLGALFPIHSMTQVIDKVAFRSGFSIRSRLFVGGLVKLRMFMTMLTTKTMERCSMLQKLTMLNDLFIGVKFCKRALGKN